MEKHLLPLCAKGCGHRTRSAVGICRQCQALERAMLRAATKLTEKETAKSILAVKLKIMDGYWEYMDRKGRSPDARPVVADIPTYESKDDPRNLASGPVGKTRRTLADLEVRR